jgi:hypothetical protein
MTHILLVRLHRQSYLILILHKQKDILLKISHLYLLFLGLFLWLIFIGKSLKRRSGKIGARITRQKALSILVYM